MTSTTYQVTGMTCEHCVRAVTEEIETLDGVSAVTVRLVPGGMSAVTVTSDALLPTEAVESALDEAGAYGLADGAEPAGNGPGHVTAPTSARALPLA
jgi:copper chaperone